MSCAEATVHTAGNPAALRASIKDGMGTAIVLSGRFTLEDAIGSRAFSIEALSCV